MTASPRLVNSSPSRGYLLHLKPLNVLFTQVFQNYGLPEEIVSDRGPQFISRVWKAFFRLLGVTVSLSSGYHPQTNGQTERRIQELGRYLRSYCHDDQHSWSRYLPWGEYAQNSLRQNTTGLTPFQCILGYQHPLFPWTGEPSEVPAVDYWFRVSERVWDLAHVHLQQAVRRHKIFADARRAATPRYQPGDLVWLPTRDLCLRLPSKKLSLLFPCFIGPFPIQRQINEVTYLLQLPPRYRIHPSFHVSLLKPCSSSSAWKLLPSVFRWVLHTVERGYRIQLGSPLPRFNGVNPTLVGPEQALVMEREVEYSLEEGGHQGGPSSRKRVRVLQPVLHSSQEGWRVASHFRSASVKPLSQQIEVQDAHTQTGKYLRSSPRTGLSI